MPRKKRKLEAPGGSLVANLQSAPTPAPELSTPAPELNELLNGLYSSTQAAVTTVGGSPAEPACVTTGVMTATEADSLVSWARNQGFSFGWGSNDPHAALRQSHRSAYSVEVDDAAMADKLWQRLGHAVPQRIELNGAERGDSSLTGTWRAVGLHPRLLFVEYKDGGHFSPHVDGFLVAGLHTRSLYTALIYLNDLGPSDGGETNLLAVAEDERSPSGDMLIPDPEGRYRGQV